MNRLTVGDVAKRLRRHPEVVREWLRDGRLRGERMGHSWLITERELERFSHNPPERRGRPKK